MVGSSTWQFGLVDPTNATQVAQYYTNHAVPQRFNPGIIVASIAVAILGAYSTLLVLGRRTSNKGARNIFLLVLAATTMSFVGIWGMHFIGMHMSLEPAPGVSWYINFNPGFTVFSLIVPGIALILAFVFVDQAVEYSLWRIIASGTLTGCIVALMHYSASFNANFKVIYNPAQTVVSIILACVGASVALSMFFRYQAHWENSWWKRLVCALILATAVSGMHYMGVWGTSYQVRRDQLDNVDSLTMGNKRNTIVVLIIGIMCGLNIVISTFLAVTDVLVNRETRRKARKIVVASATFDRSGRMLVRADGSMPMVVLETKLRQAEVLDALDKRSPTFQWLYLVSWDWLIIAPFLGAIAKRLFQIDSAQHQQQQQPLSSETPRRGVSFEGLSNRHPTSASTVAADDKRQALVDFKDRVIFAAHQLSQELEVSLDQVGVLYDHVLPTGTKRAAEIAAAKVEANKRLPGYNADEMHLGRKKASETMGRAEHGGEDDEESRFEATVSIFGRGDEEDEGVTIFLVRELPHASLEGAATLPGNTGGTGAGAEAGAAVGATADKYKSRGYRMTETRFLAGVLADRHGVVKDEMETLLESLRVYARRGIRPVVQPGGVYAGLFGVRPSASRQGGLDVLVYNFARHQLPSYRLPDVSCLTPPMRAFLRLLDQLPLNEAMKACERDSVRSSERKKQLFANRQTQVDQDREETDEEQQEREEEMLAEEELLESMIRFQTALYVSLDALNNSVRFYPNLVKTARISAEVLEVPSSLNDSTAPAEIILVQAVLPEDREYAVMSTFTSNSGNASSLSSSHGPHQRSASRSQQEATTENVGAGLVMPTDKSNAASPFVFTPYTLFAKAQMMLMRGRQAEDFEHEVLIEMKRRFVATRVQPPKGEGEQQEEEEGAMERDDSEKSFGLDKVGDERVEGDKSMKKWFDFKWLGLGRSKKSQRPASRAAKTVSLSLRRLSAASSSFKSSHGGIGPVDEEIAQQEGSILPTLGQQEVGPDPDEINEQQQQLSYAPKMPTKPAVGPPHQHQLDISSLMTDALNINASTVGSTPSLGVRRFTTMRSTVREGAEEYPSLTRGASLTSNTPIPQSRFARAAEEDDEVGEVTLVSSPPRVAPMSYSKRHTMSPRTPVRRTSRTWSQSQGAADINIPSWDLINSSTSSITKPGRSLRPSTADADSRRPRLHTSIRPNTAGALPTSGPVSPTAATMLTTVEGSVNSGSSTSSQRGQRASSSSFRKGTVQQQGKQAHAPNSASIRARLQSDDWYSRQLMSLERGPLGHQLLGVLPSEY